MSDEARSDPFAMTANPAAYVPRVATERALAELGGALDAGAPVVLLSGPAGLGKTVLLRLLEPRLRGRRTFVYLPYAALPAADACAWALAVLGRPAQGDAAAALGALARDFAARGAPLVLVLDDGSAIPLDAARRLAALTVETPGALSLLVALTDDAKSETVIAAFGGAARSVRLEEPLAAAESAAYLAARLAQVSAPADVRRRFDAVMLDRLHRAARGVPRVLHRLASEVIRRGPEALLTLELDEPAFEPERAPAFAPKRGDAPPPTPAAARVVVLEAESARVAAASAAAAPPTPAKDMAPAQQPSAPKPESATAPAPTQPISTPKPAAEPPAAAPRPTAEPVAPAPTPAAEPARPAPGPTEEPPPQAVRPTAEPQRPPPRPTDAPPPPVPKPAAEPPRPASRPTDATPPPVSRPATATPILPAPAPAAEAAAPVVNETRRVSAPPAAPPAARTPHPTPIRVDSVADAPATAAKPAEPLPRAALPTPTRVEAPAKSTAEPTPSHAPERATPLPPSSGKRAESAAPPRTPAVSKRMVGPIQIILGALVIGVAAIGISMLLSRLPGPDAKVPTAPRVAVPTPAPPPTRPPPHAAEAPSPPPRPAPVTPAPAPTRAAPQAATPLAAAQEPAPASVAPPSAVPAPRAEPLPTPVVQALPAPAPHAAPVPLPPTPPKPARAAPPVSVAVNATPWARIEIDGHEVGETPLAGIMLSSGPHAFRAHLPDGRVLERSVEIDAKNRFVTFR